MREPAPQQASFLTSPEAGELELRFKTGDSCTLYYPYLLRSRLDITGSIELQFSTDKVVIEGQHLQRLYDDLKKKRVAWIREAGCDSAKYSGEETFVRSIVVTPVG